MTLRPPVGASAEVGAYDVRIGKKSLDVEEFARKLRAKESGYHTHHQFHIMMNEDRLTREQIRGSVANYSF